MHSAFLKLPVRMRLAAVAVLSRVAAVLGVVGDDSTELGALWMASLGLNGPLHH